MANYGGIEGDRLKQLIERIETLESEKADIAEHIRDVFADAKNEGFDVKIMRQIIKLRKQEQHERDEQEILLDIYKRALGLLPDTQG